MRFRLHSQATKLMSQIEASFSSSLRLQQNDLINKWEQLVMESLLREIRSRHRNFRDDEMRASLGHVLLFGSHECRYWMKELLRAHSWKNVPNLFSVHVLASLKPSPFATVPALSCSLHAARTVSTRWNLLLQCQPLSVNEAFNIYGERNK